MLYSLQGKHNKFSIFYKVTHSTTSKFPTVYSKQPLHHIDGSEDWDKILITSCNKPIFHILVCVCFKGFHYFFSQESQYGSYNRFLYLELCLFLKYLMQFGFENSRSFLSLMCPLYIKLVHQRVRVLNFFMVLESKMMRGWISGMKKRMGKAFRRCVLL